MSELISIGELARRMGVTVRTLQWYDKQGLLSPSAFSEGGQRKYSSKDIVRLHQILAFKHLGFTLEEIKVRLLPMDSPEEVAKILDSQLEAVHKQIEELTAVAGAIEALSYEVKHTETVDFRKYAEIIELLKVGNPDYWVWKAFDDEVTDHIRKRFTENPALGKQLVATYNEVVDRAFKYKQQGIPPEAPECIELAAEWWNMIESFTGGDMSLLPKLMEFNENKDNWDSAAATKQKEVDGFIGIALSLYMEQKGISEQVLG